MILILSWVPVLCYAIALAILWQYITQTSKHTDTRRATIIMISIVGLIFHTLSLTLDITQQSNAGLKLPSPLYFNLSDSLSIAALVISLVFIFLSMIRQTLNLGLAILPMAIFAQIASLWIGEKSSITTVAHVSFEWHLALGIIAFGLLTLAFSQSILILIQDKQLKSRAIPSASTSFIALPALQSMETLLFQLIWLGFIVLSATLFLGLILNQGIQGAALSFTHHIVLTIITWIAYAILLTGRHFSGWRGRHAARYTILCYALFLLGYFGSRVVNDLIIN